MIRTRKDEKISRSLNIFTAIVPAERGSRRSLRRKFYPHERIDLAYDRGEDRGVGGGEGAGTSEYLDGLIIDLSYRVDVSSTEDIYIFRMDNRADTGCRREGRRIAGRGGSLYFRSMQIFAKESLHFVFVFFFFFFFGAFRDVRRFFHRRSFSQLKAAWWIRPSFTLIMPVKTTCALFERVSRYAIFIIQSQEQARRACLQNFTGAPTARVVSRAKTG